MFQRLVLAAGAASLLGIGWQWSIDARPTVHPGSAQVVANWYATARTAPATPVQLARVLAMVQSLDEVASVGRDSSTTRTADQTGIAHFWFEPPYDSWSRIASIVQADEHLDLHQTARLYALVNMAVCDSLIAGWHWKRQFALWRPITAIAEADTDGNPLTIADPAWTPLRTTPFHPDHPSTHSVAGAAAAEVIRRVTGSDERRFCMSSLTANPPGSTRCFETFSQAQRENMESRIYAGIHFRTAGVSGDQLGRRIGRFAFDHALRPLPPNEHP